MGEHNLVQFEGPHAPNPKTVPGTRFPPALASTGSPLQGDSKPHTEFLRDIFHEEADSMPKSQSRPANSSLPDAGNVRKTSGPSARKDEWEDSSDEGGGEHATVPNYKTSKPFHSRMTDSLPNEGRVANKTTRFHKITKPRGAAVKELSWSKTAVDFRNRRDVEEAYRRKVYAMIDDDILARVDTEGGITPTGRFYKAVYRMMERKDDNKLQAAEKADHDEMIRLRAENQLMKDKIEEAARALRSV